jgi:ABC-type lipoprotein release transport system permease subunit
MSLFLLQAAALGAAGGAAGVVLAVACSYGADYFAAAYLPDFPFKPDTFFRFEAWIVGLALLLSFLTCVAGAWWPARKAARQNPMEVLD